MMGALMAQRDIAKMRKCNETAKYYDECIKRELKERFILYVKKYGGKDKIPKTIMDFYGFNNY